jgi:hypothetical protein
MMQELKFISVYGDDGADEVRLDYMVCFLLRDAANCFQSTRSIDVEIDWSTHVIERLVFSPGWTDAEREILRQYCNSKSIDCFNNEYKRQLQSILFEGAEMELQEEAPV